MKWIRWQGVIAFAVITAVIAGFWLLLLDGLVKRGIEKTGEMIVGAEVNVNDLDIKFFPLGATIKGLQVTNPDAPETNSIEFGRIAFSIDTLNMLRQKAIINEMAVEAVRFDTPRKRPGRVKKKEEKKEDEGDKRVLGLVKIPSVKEILQTETLESVKLLETAREDMQKRKADWQQRIQEMPNKAKLDAYKNRIDKVKQAKRDILGMTSQLSEVNAIKKDIEQDRDRVKSARTAFTNDLSTAKNVVDKAEQAPFNDVRRLRDKYSISPEGLQNMTDLLFGGEISSWVRTGLRWYYRAQPIVERAQAAQAAQKKDVKVVKHIRDRGVDVKFREFRPMPDFLITRTAVSAETKAGLLAGNIMNITPDQNILGKPLTFSLSGEKLRSANMMAITGTLNHIIPAKSNDTAKFVMRGFKVNNFVLSKSKDLPIAMQEALMDFEINGSFTDALKATLTANINSAKMQVGGEDSSNPFVQSLRKALSNVSQFSLTADISGTLENYTTNISSDLDRVLKTAVSSMVQEQSARLEKELKTAIQEKTGAKVKELQESYGGLNQEGTKLENIQKQLDSLLDEAVKSAGGKLKLR